MANKRDRLARLERGRVDMEAAKEAAKYRIGDPESMDAMPLDERQEWLASWVEHTHKFYSGELPNHKLAKNTWTAEDARLKSTVPADAPVRSWVQGERSWMDGHHRPPRTPAHFLDQLAWIARKDLWFLGVTTIK